MGFLDKARKIAEQAQAKLDEVQGQFNQSQAGQPHAGPAPEYDKHGRPVQPDPLTPDTAAAQPPAATPGVPPTQPAEPEEGPGRAGPRPSAPTTPATPPAEDPNRPPTLSSGDPLAG